MSKNNFGAEAGVRSTGKITLNRKGRLWCVRLDLPPCRPPQNNLSPRLRLPQCLTLACNPTSACPPQGACKFTTTDQVNMNVSIGGNVIPGGVNMNVQMRPQNLGPPRKPPRKPPPSHGAAKECPVAATAEMSGLDFRDYLRTISKDFEDSKMSTAQAPLAGAMLSSLKSRKS